MFRCFQLKTHIKSFQLKFKIGHKKFCFPRKQNQLLFLNFSARREIQRRHLDHLYSFSQSVDENQHNNHRILYSSLLKIFGRRKW